MDESVLRATLKWPNVPAVYGWLALDRRGTWLIRGERIGNAALREFIGRNYAPDERGRWFCPFSAATVSLDEEGSILLHGDAGIALLDDRGLERFADRAEALPRIASADVASQFGFVPDAVESLR